MRVFVTLVIIYLVVVVAPVMLGVLIWAFKKLGRRPLFFGDAILEAYEAAYPKRKN